MWIQVHKRSTPHTWTAGIFAAGRATPGYRRAARQCEAGGRSGGGVEPCAGWLAWCVRCVVMIPACLRASPASNHVGLVCLRRKLPPSGSFEQPLVLTASLWTSSSSSTLCDVRGDRRGGRLLTCDDVTMTSRSRSGGID